MPTPHTHQQKDRQRDRRPEPKKKKTPSAEKRCTQDASLLRWCMGEELEKSSSHDRVDHGTLMLCLLTCPVLWESGRSSCQRCQSCHRRHGSVILEGRARLWMVSLGSLLPCLFACSLVSGDGSGGFSGLNGMADVQLGLLRRCGC